MNAHMQPVAATDWRVSEIEFLGWLGQAEPGDVLAYHRGLLAADRVHSADLGHLANRAFSLAETSLIHLVQRRHGAEDFSYLAVARPKAREAGMSMSALLLAEPAAVSATANTP